MDRPQKKKEKRKKKKRPCPRLSPPVSRGKPAVRGRNLLCGWGGGAKQGKTSFTAVAAAAAAAVALNHQLSEPTVRTSVPITPSPLPLLPGWLPPTVNSQPLPYPTLPKPYPANSSFRASILEWRSSSSTRSLIIMFDVSNLTSLPSSVCLFFKNYLFIFFFFFFSASCGNATTTYMGGCKQPQAKKNK